MLPLKKKHILITSGPTRGYLDAIRYISNRSTGKLGSKIALAALTCGADVTMIYGNGSAIPELESLNHESGAKLSLINIETNEALIDTIENKLKDVHFDAIVHAMAILDFAPEIMRDEKTSSNNSEWAIKLIKTRKVIKLIKEIWPDAFTIGFKLEVNKTKDELINKAMLFLSENETDVVVANDLNEINVRQHKAYVINKDGNVEAIYKNKDEIASGLIRLLAKQMREDN